MIRPPVTLTFGSTGTGYKIYHRYKGCGIEGLTDRSRRPQRHANQLPMAIEKLIVRLKRKYPTWGAPKIRERRQRRYTPVQCPAISTVHAVLDRHGLVKRRGRRRHRAQGTALSWPAEPLSCEALSSTRETYAFAVFERVFKDFGLPQVIRTDNGVPFASAHALYGLSTLAVGWLRLGIQIERIKPGHPEQNGRHERMHLTLKTEATKPAAANVLQQQARFDAFVDRFNHERPHQALAMKVPADVYTPSARPYRGLAEVDYPLHDWTAMVTRCGRICWKRRKINLSRALPGSTSA